MRFSKLYISVVVGLVSNQAMGLWAPGSKSNFSMRPKGIELMAHPLQILSPLAGKKSFGLLNKQAITFEGAIKGYIGNKLGFSPLGVRTSLKNTGLSLDGKQDGLEIGFSFNGIPVCGYQVKATRLKDGTTFILGKMPDVDDRQWSDPNDWPEYTYVHDTVFENITEWSEKSSVKILSKEKCYYVENGTLVPVWKSMINIDGVGHRVVASQYQMYQHEKVLFDIDGKIKGYSRNPDHGEVKTYTVTMNGNGYLDNSYFTTTTGKIDRAYKEDNNFLYETTDQEFSETTSFLAASRMYDFFKGIGYSWQGAKPLAVNLHVIIGGTKNNALYQPGESTSTGKPSISIGDGDGEQLENLPYDIDVVAHEFGHHVVYSTLSSIVGESLVLHEGLADFFAFSMTGDSCLGESICPEQSLACWEKAQCLRTASNSIRYDDSIYPKLQPHLKGQLVSGFLWDLYETQSIPLTDVASLTYKAVSMLVATSGLHDLIVGLLMGDKEINSGKYACKIVEAAEARGFSDLLGDVDCEKSSTFGAINGVNQTLVTSTPTTRTTSTSGGTCGVAGSKKQSSAGILFLLLLACLPYAFSKERSKIAAEKR